MTFPKITWNREQRRTVKKGLLSNVDVSLISLLYDDMKPCNGKSAVVKCDGKKMKSIGSSGKFTVEKAEGGEGRIYVTIMEPDVTDPQGDRYTKEEVVKACENFAKKGMVRKNDVNHNLEIVDGVFIGQSSILNAPDKEHYPDTKIGSWVGVVKFDDTNHPLYKKAQDGKFNGVSIYGDADDEVNPDLEEVRKGISSIMKAIEALGANPDPDKVKNLKDEAEKLRKTAGMDPQAGEMSEVVKSLNLVVKALDGLSKKILEKGFNPLITDEGGKGMDQEIILQNGQKLIVKAERHELYKALADVYSGTGTGILTANQLSQFLDAIITAGGDMLADFTFLPIDKNGKVDVGLLADMVLYNSADSRTAQTVGTGDLDCAPAILTSETILAEATMEFYKDKLGSKEAFGAYIEQAITGKVRQALYQLVFAGDRTATADTNQRAIDGIVKKATTANALNDISVDSVTDPTLGSVLISVLDAFDEAVLMEQGFNIYLAKTMYLKLSKLMMDKPTALGDRFTVSGGKIFFSGYEVKMGVMPSNIYICAGVSKMVVIGYIDDAKIKVEHTGTDWKYHFYTRTNLGFNYVSTKFKVFRMIAE